MNAYCRRLPLRNKFVGSGSQSQYRTAMNRLYPDRTYTAAPDAGNFWQSTTETPQVPTLAGDLETEVAIIGAGYTGLNAALQLAEKHGIKVTVIDATWPGWGASGRNGGFVGFGGSKLSDQKLFSKFGDAEARKFFAAQRDAIETVRENLDRYVIEADAVGQGEYYLAHRPKEFAGMPEEARFLKDIHGSDVPVLSPDALAERGLNSPGFHGGMHVPFGFAINPLKYVLGLSDAAQRLGVDIYGQTKATKIERHQGGYRITTTNGVLQAQKLLIATNGYSTDGLPDAINGWFLPILSNILVTRPLTESERQDQGWTATDMVADTRNLLHYIRLLPDGRFLFGMRGGTGFSPRDEATMKRRARKSFETLLPAWADVETPYFWSGLACLSRSLNAYIGPLAGMENAYGAMGYHGSGIAMASWAGRSVADIIAGVMQPSALPANLRQPMKPFPFPAARRHYLKAAYAWYGVKDR